MNVVIKMDNWINVFRINLNYVYKEMIHEFISNGGICKESTYNLINWPYILRFSKCIVTKFQFFFYKYKILF